MKKLLVLFFLLMATTVHAADTKVSALTELATTPAASDEFYINDGGTSKKIQYSNIMAGEATTAAALAANPAAATSGSCITNIAANGDVEAEVDVWTEAENTSAAYAPLTAPTFETSITGNYLTASEIVITDASKNIVSGAVATYPSLAELAYVKDVTSAIQTQLNAKDAVTTAGDYLTRTTNDFDADAELYTITKCAVIETPTDADNFLIYHVELGMQVTAVHCIVEAATSATIEIEQCDVAGDNCTAVTTALVCDVGGQADDGTIDAPDLDVDDWVRLDVTATSGTPGHVTACFTATMDD